VHTDQLKVFERRLLELRTEIEALADTRKEAGSTVELDQTRTGRLSRMDALQGQAMAKATQARADLEFKRITAALARIEDGSYGECLKCGEDIAEKRLEANPTVTLCIRCAEAKE
jgi:DnaK suppressor protein